MSWRDFKLGFRMLVKFPGLTFVAGVAIAFAITLGAGTFQFTGNFFCPKMPFEGGDRVVEIRNRDLATGSPDPRALHDYVTWRDELHTVEEIGAFQTLQRNLLTERGTASPMIEAALTVDAFHIARTPPVLGRPISETDEVPGAPNVVLIAYDVWQGQFGSDPDVVGKTVRLASEQATIIGVMPEGFGWPRAHKIWTPLRLNALDDQRGQSPAIQVVDKLARGTSLREARAEVAAIGRRTAADYPTSHGRLQAEI